MSGSGSGPRNNRSRWTLSDLRYLEQHYCTRPLAELADYLGRSSGAVALMADRLNCRRQKSLPWTDAEMDIVRQHYGNGMGAEFCSHCCRAKCPGHLQYGRKNGCSERAVLAGRGTDHSAYVYYPAEGALITARVPGRNGIAVRIMARRLGLKKSATCISGFRPWNEEEWQRLRDNIQLSITEQQRTLFPDRAVLAVEKARVRLLKKMDHVNHADEMINQE